MKSLTDAIVKFRDKRGWKALNTPKESAISLLLEASELLEHFQWKSDEEVKTYLSTNRDAVASELADVIYWALLMSHDLGIDVEEAVENKLVENRKKYPLEKSVWTGR